jgi:hypothetical protein
MTPFTLDTSGRVAGNLEGLAVWYEFEDLDPFTQGYIEALFASDVVDDDPEVPPLTLGRLKGFSDLAPETLQRIVTDCERFDVAQDDDGDWLLVPPAEITVFSEPGEPWLVTDDAMRGADWSSTEDVRRACGRYLWGAFALAPYLGDDGKVYLREGAY